MFGVLYRRGAYLSRAVLSMLACVLARSALNELTFETVRSTTHNLTTQGARSASHSLTFVRAMDGRQCIEKALEDDARREAHRWPQEEPRLPEPMRPAWRLTCISQRPNV